MYSPLVCCNPNFTAEPLPLLVSNEYIKSYKSLFSFKIFFVLSVDPSFITIISFSNFLKFNFFNSFRIFNIVFSSLNTGTIIEKILN